MKNKLNEILEALLLSASRPINIDEMIKVFDDPKPSKDDIRSALNQSRHGAGSSSGSSLLAVEIETGRPHQIRIHLAAAGYPLVGDPLYGRGSSLQQCA